MRPGTPGFHQKPSGFSARKAFAFCVLDGFARLTMSEMAYPLPAEESFTASLTRAVGRGAENPLKREVPARPAVAEPPSSCVLPRIAEDGGQGDETYTRDRRVPSRVMKLKTPDGRVDPDGKTGGRSTNRPAAVTPRRRPPPSRRGRCA